jgi:hypothetical protein
MSVPIRVSFWVYTLENLLTKPVLLFNYWSVISILPVLYNPVTELRRNDALGGPYQNVAVTLPLQFNAD